MSLLDKSPRIDIEKPKFDMSTYIGRAKHFFLLTNPLNIIASYERLTRACEVVTAYRAKAKVPYIKTIDELWHEKYLYDSAFHPDTGRRMFIFGRMSAQVPANTVLIGCMVIFYKTRSQVLFFQWVNQTFNAIVNYTNRSGKSEITPKQILQAYCMATFGAMATAYSLKYFAKSMPSLIERLVPFAAVAAANCVNLPLMRQNELKNGITLLDQNDREVGMSRKAALIGIYQVVFSRIMMCTPAMVLTPMVIEKLEKSGYLRRHPKMNAPIQAAVVGFTLLFSTPLGCAFFRQKTSMKVERLEAEVREAIKKKYPNLTDVYYNKGL